MNSFEVIYYIILMYQYNVGFLVSNNQQQANMFGSSSIFNDIEQNFFSAAENPIPSEKSDKQSWINDVDSSLILENIDRTAQNRVVKINLKLKTLEKTLSKVSEELKVLQLFNLDEDKVKREQMLILKQNIENQIISLKEEKKKFGIFYIISAYTNNKVTYEKLCKLANSIAFIARKYFYILLDYARKNAYVQKLLKMVLK